MKIDNKSDFVVACTNCCSKRSWGEYFNSLTVDMSTGVCGKCDGATVKLDSLLFPIMVVLWKKGYETTYSCMGHLKKNTGYKGDPYLGLKKWTIATNIPLGWKKDGKFIRYKKRNLMIGYFSLMEWVKNLPYKKKTNRKNKHKLIDSKYNNNITIFLGNNAFKKHKNLYINYENLKNLKKLSDLKDKKKIIIDARLLFKFALELEIYKHLFLNKEIVIVFKLNYEKERYSIPTGLSGWGMFANKKYYVLLNLLLRIHSPRVQTADNSKIYNVKYVL